ncbi:MAG: hypothetical protein MJH11_19080 [Lentisphaeria bacterium]|nr:hypothetical protein [Lentisphaeria bacterium]
MLYALYKEKTEILFASKDEADEWSIGEIRISVSKCALFAGISFTALFIFFSLFTIGGTRNSSEISTDVKVEMHMSFANMIDAEGWTGYGNMIPVGLAIRSNKENDYEYILNFAKRNFSMKHYRRLKYYYLLHAVKTNDSDLFRILLKNKTYIDYKGRLEHWQLAVAIAAENKEFVDIFLSLGLKFNKKSYAPIRQAVKTSPEFVEFLISRGANIHQTWTRRRYSFGLVSDAGYSGDLKMMKYLIGKGLDPEFNNNLLFSVIQSNSKDRNKLFSYMLKLGHDIKKKNLNGDIILHSFCDEVFNNHDKHTDESDMELLELILEKGGNINVKDSNGKTVLHNSFVGKKHHLLSMYLKHGADPNIKDADNRTAIDFVLEYRQGEEDYIDDDYNPESRYEFQDDCNDDEEIPYEFEDEYEEEYHIDEVCYESKMEIYRIIKLLVDHGAKIPEKDSKIVKEILTYKDLKVDSALQ